MHFLQELVEREFDIGTKHFPFGDYVLFILTILSLDDELLLSGENQYVYFWLLFFFFFHNFSLRATSYSVEVLSRVTVVK